LRVSSDLHVEDFVPEVLVEVKTLYGCVKIAGLAINEGDLLFPKLINPVG
jgi:hypothetical protein